MVVREFQARGGDHQELVAWHAVTFDVLIELTVGRRQITVTPSPPATTCAVHALDNTWIQAGAMTWASEEPPTRLTPRLDIEVPTIRTATAAVRRLRLA